MLTNEQAIAQRLIGRVLDDKYRLRACIGIGGSGAVYRADQIALGRTVAVKILNDELTRDPRLVKRFQDEALAASRLNHPNTVSIIDYGQTADGLLYLVMEHLHGPTLTHLIAKEHPLPAARVLGIVEQILAGVEEAHLAGVIHADLKSDNIIVEQRRTGADQVKVVDFGIARLVNAPREGEDRNICGTPEYMAPELIGGGAAIGGLRHLRDRRHHLRATDRADAVRRRHLGRRPDPAAPPAPRRPQRAGRGRPGPR
jgi:serine/threonine protein kinase